LISDNDQTVVIWSVLTKTPASIVVLPLTPLQFAIAASMLARWVAQWGSCTLRRA
jgi:hypothetical protein